MLIRIIQPEELELCRYSYALSLGLIEQLSSHNHQQCQEEEEEDDEEEEMLDHIIKYRVKAKICQQGSNSQKMLFLTKKA